MHKKCQYLLLSDDCKHCQSLVTILNFLNLPLNVVDAKNWQAQTDQNHYAAIVICSFISSSILTQQIQQLQHYYPDVAGLTLGDLPNEPQVNDFIIGSLSLPLQQHCLLQSLHKCQIYFQQHDMNDFPQENLILDNIIGQSRVISQLRKSVMQAANCEDSSVLIIGEHGTGKELVASTIHNLSRRRNKPFVPVNCAAIPAELMESELFGHEKEAFIGAINDRVGRFELANGGSLYLNEIEELPLAMQIKLLHLLDEKSFTKMGSNTNITCDVRIVAAACHSLEEAIAKNQFREDLYYRLNIFPIEIKPLRQHAEDIPVLLEFAIRKLNQQLKCSLCFTDDALEVLSQYAWPGNIGELNNLVERLMILFPNGVIDISDLPEKYFVDKSLSATVKINKSNNLIGKRFNLKKYLSETELSLITDALHECRGNITKTAKYLGMGRTTLIEKMRKYELHYSKDQSAEGVH